MRDVRTRRDGTFEIRLVPPGAYTPIAQRQDGQTAFTRVEARNGDVDRIRLNFVSSAQLNGRIVVEGGAINLRDVRVKLNSIVPVVASLRSGVPQTNGAFALENFFPGNDYWLDVSELPRNAYVKSMRFSDGAILEGGIVCREGVIPSTITFNVLLGADGGSVSGTVINDAAMPVSGATVAFIPDPARRARPEQYRAIVTGEQGAFGIPNVPPGDYLVFAMPRLLPNAISTPNSLQTTRAWDRR